MGSPYLVVVVYGTDVVPTFGVPRVLEGAVLAFHSFGRNDTFTVLVAGATSAVFDLHDVTTAEQVGEIFSEIFEGCLAFLAVQVGGDVDNVVFVGERLIGASEHFGKDAGVV